MSTVHIPDASPKLQAASGKGKHRGWSTFDIALEGSRFQALHDLVSAPAFDGHHAIAVLDELEALAQSYGYGQADSYLAGAEGLSDEEISANPFLAMQRDSTFKEDGEEDQYFIEVRNSERILLAAAATPEARAFLGGSSHGEDRKGAWGPVHERMKGAFRRGRDMRESLSSQAPQP